MKLAITPTLLAAALVTVLMAGCETASPALIDRGDAAYNRGEYAEALALFDQAIKQVPTSADAQQGRAKALLALKRPQEAETAFALAAGLVLPGHDEQLADILDGQAAAILAQGETQYQRLSRFVADQCRKHDGIRDFMRQARSLEASGDHDGAKLSLKKAETRAWDTDDKYVRVRTYMAISDFHVARGDLENAKLYLRYAAYVNPAYPGVSERFRKLGIVPGPAQMTEPPKPESAR